MDMTKLATKGLAVVSLAVLGSVAVAGGHETTFTGPHAAVLKERHELMEGMGKEAKNIKEAMNAGSSVEMAVVQRSADVIVESSTKITQLFPKGSTSPESRAKANIWDDWNKFEAAAKQLQERATAVRTAAASDDDAMINDLVKAMGGACKSCHDDFRKPEEK